MLWSKKTMGGKPSTMTAAVLHGFLSYWVDDSFHMEASFPWWQQLSTRWFQVKAVVDLVDTDRKLCRIVDCHRACLWCKHDGDTAFPFVWLVWGTLEWKARVDGCLCTLLITTNHFISLWEECIDIHFIQFEEVVIHWTLKESLMCK